MLKYATFHKDLDAKTRTSKLEIFHRFKEWFIGVQMHVSLAQRLKIELTDPSQGNFLEVFSKIEGVHIRTKDKLYTC